MHAVADAAVLIVVVEWGAGGMDLVGRFGDSCGPCGAMAMCV